MKKPTEWRKYLREDLAPSWGWTTEEVNDVEQFIGQVLEGLGVYKMHHNGYYDGRPEDVDGIR